MVNSGTSGATPFMMYTFMPTGGVITPISLTRVMMMPNQIGIKTQLGRHGEKNRYGEQDEAQSVHKTTTHQINGNNQYHYGQGRHIQGNRPIGQGKRQAGDGDELVKYDGTHHDDQDHGRGAGWWKATNP